MIDNPYPFPIIEKDATVRNRFQMMRLMWAVANDTKFGPPYSNYMKFRFMWVAFKHNFLTLHPRVAYRKPE